MKFPVFAILAAFVLAGCTPTPSRVPPVPAPPTIAPPPPRADVSGAATQAGQAVADSALPTIPGGALYTLYCLSIPTPTHVPDSDHLKDELIRTTHSKNWYVLHSEGQSTLYYGFYKTFTDKNQPEERARAQADHQFVAQLRDNNGELPFARCFFVPLSSPDPQAPPEWNIEHAPGFWSLQIAAYTGSIERKKYAVDAVRAARAQGIMAYYYHGPTVSSVFIGAWPREAIKEQDSSVASSDDPNKTLIVLPAPLPAGTKTDNLFTKDGHPAKIVVPRVEVQDPTLLAAMRLYPENAVNGEVQMHKVNTGHAIIEEPDPSFIVQIPRDEQNPDAADASANPAP